MSYHLECPVCDHRHYMGDYPDHWTRAPSGSRFDFDCAACEAKFWVTVKWEPEFTVEDPPAQNPAQEQRSGEPET